MQFYVLLVLSCTFLITNGNIVYPCTTPDNEKAYCMSLFSCPHLMKLLGTLEPSAINVVRKSLCLGCEARDIMVCCGTPKNNTVIENVPLKPTKPITMINRDPSITTANKKDEANDALADKRKLLPSLGYCGLQHTDDRFYNETNTALDEFPWLVHIKITNLEYETEYADRCSGVLISNRYVLTDAYCGFEGLKVLLGQYNTNKSVSCIDNPDFDECTEPITEVFIEEKIRDGKSANGPYDFHLLRLAKTVAYSDFIRAICLPMNEAKRPANLQTLTFSGWGAPNAEGVTKKRLNYDVVDKQVCYKEKTWLQGNVEFANVSFICVSPQKTNIDAACNGEHGGPFMYSQKNQWFLEGIVIDANSEESASSYCSRDKPVNGIKITPKTIRWILESIRP